MSLYLLRRISISCLYISGVEWPALLLDPAEMKQLKNIQGSYVTPKDSIAFSTFLLCILELSNSNFGPECSYSNLNFRRVQWFL
jgi:hypothetical protein